MDDGTGSGVGVDALRKTNGSARQQTTDPAVTDAVFKFDNAEQQRAMQGRPWTKDPHYFKKVRISAVALIKMVMHARSGGALEVMGLMQGKVNGDTMLVMDSFALPVEGTETRVNAQAEGYEYMVQYLDKVKEVGRLENAIGWYHSHPGYGCWLSGIDVSTQMLNQQFQEPWLAVVIDPNRTISSGKVEIGAFRTYPKDYRPPDEPTSEYQSIPLSKIEDFGVHVKSYYQLEISTFKSSLDAHLLDLLWNKYWVNTLSSSPLITNRPFRSRQILDLAEKLEQAESSISQHGGFGGMGGGGGSRGGAMYAGGASSSSAGESKEKKEEGPLAKVNKDSFKITSEAAHGLISQMLKDVLFNTAVAGRE
ncbi:putative JUN activation binding protein variant 2 [Gonapodya prolifera JEL478]|uniref:COP9 signalosome complex subunit 5 n=1 Tax=Gonapodya prolifera (strain JEL478) TaxID=1344416 RepID=A0A139AZB7_GONPJ|nr:putative JUN activation binding protein variant 2 [Gonapodya prolifera JEL478]|eukprot:KXS22076.1 putative JUN activation binding protein variant 2 [Gonapodya prolifera JEL478]